MIFYNILEIAKNIGKIKEGENLKSLKDKINRIKKLELKNKNRDLPKILCLEWLNPFFTAGHWVPGGNGGDRRRYKWSKQIERTITKNF